MMSNPKIKARLHYLIDKVEGVDLSEIYRLLTQKVEAMHAPFSIEQYNRELEEAEQRIDNGKYFTLSEQ